MLDKFLENDIVHITSAEVIIIQIVFQVESIVAQIAKEHLFICF